MNISGPPRTGESPGGGPTPSKPIGFLRRLTITTAAE